jgi:ureidoglycolate dehydrogenase (NAD+)
MNTSKRLMSADSLLLFVTDIFAAAGMRKADARTVAEVLVWANCRGIDSHGVTRVPIYLAEIKRSEFNVQGAHEIHQLLPATFKMDCARTAGPVCMMQAAAKCIQLADTFGVGLGLLSAPTHLGAIGFYTNWIAQRGYAAIVFVAGRPFMAYHGARTASLGTSPISIAVPTDDPEAPLLLDMASSVIAAGRIRQAAANGQTLPAEAAIDSNGNFTTDPAQAKTVVSLGGPKGSGLALLFECLTGVLAATPIIGMALNDHPPLQNAMVICVNISNFRAMPDYVSDINRLKAAVQELPRRDGFSELLLPGQRGSREARRRKERGIPVPEDVWQELAVEARSLNVALPDA